MYRSSTYTTGSLPCCCLGRGHGHCYDSDERSPPCRWCNKHHCQSVQCLDPRSAQNEAMYKEARQQARKSQPVDAALARERAKLAKRESPYVTMPERESAYAQMPGEEYAYAETHEKESAYADMPEKESTYGRLVERDSAYGRQGERDSAYGRQGERTADGRRVVREGRVSWR